MPVTVVTVVTVGGLLLAAFFIVRKPRPRLQQAWFALPMIMLALALKVFPDVGIWNAGSVWVFGIATILAGAMLVYQIWTSPALPEVDAKNSKTGTGQKT